MERILKRDYLPQIPIHALRDSHAVLLIGSWASLEYVQKRLGHKNYQITVDKYSHISKKIEWTQWDDMNITWVLFFGSSIFYGCFMGAPIFLLIPLTLSIKTKPLNTNGIKGFLLLILRHILVTFPRVNLRSKHIPFNFFCFKEMFK
ncbi:site-specific integrase [Sutcliffiella rhizosphaerae]|uniref:hypothetical protein n=1 Tax=Sutcliffiella rhizosphaerae TaxID=2880967 RepID=UPI001E5696ED